MRALELKMSALILLAVAACSDPVEVPPEAAFRAPVSAPADLPLGVACKQTGTASFGVPAPSTARTEGGTIRDGENGAVIGCSVKGSGSYTVSANGRALGSTFSINGTVGADGTGTLSTLTLSSDATQSLENAMPCTIDAKADPAKGETLRISPGEMYAEINCPLVEARSQRPTTQCQALGVLVLLKNCSK